jgi:hypothetical protein
MFAFLMPARDRIRRAIPGCPNARHVEAVMRAEHGELNWWSQSRFAQAARAAAICAAADPVAAERVAQAIVDPPAASNEKRRWRWVLPAACIAIVLAASIMVVTSKYEDPLTPLEDFIAKHLGGPSEAKAK